LARFDFSSDLQGDSRTQRRLAGWKSGGLYHWSTDAAYVEQPVSRDYIIS